MRVFLGSFYGDRVWLFCWRAGLSCYEVRTVYLVGDGAAIVKMVTWRILYLSIQLGRLNW